MFTTDDVLAAVHSVRTRGVAATAQMIATELTTPDQWLVEDALQELVDSHHLERFEMVWSFAFDESSRVDVKTPYFVPIEGDSIEVD